MAIARVLIAGIGGASLGTEIFKSLRHSGEYEIYGCDISELAYGLYEDGFQHSVKVDVGDYISDVADICDSYKIDIIIPGADEAMTLLATATDLWREKGIHLAMNDPEVVALCADKSACFDSLRKMGMTIPLSATAEDFETVIPDDTRCVVKPASGSGGSSFVFLASDKAEAKVYVNYLLRNNKRPIIQEYLPHEDGEFTVGTLTIGNQIASVAMQRIFVSKLSVLQKSETGLISTGYSQGLIDDFPKIRETCEKISFAVGSRGPLNIQGRLKGGEFVPFEVNPRFSASSFMRTLAGFNEIDIYLRYLMGQESPFPTEIRTGYFLRSLTERFVELEDLKS